MKRTFVAAAFSFILLAPLVSQAATFSRPLVIGSHGSDVSALQQFLKDKGYFTYPTITGLYGTVTFKAVAAFQTANNLKAVGNVGPMTRALLNKNLSSAGTTAGSISATTSGISSTTAPATIPFPITLPGYAPGQLIFIGGGSPVVPDTTAPSVSLTAPASAALVSGTVALNASASDNVAVTSVQFKVDNANVGSALTAAPYTTTWDSTGVSDGSHAISVVASDAAGNIGSASINVTVDNTAPGISLIATSTVNNANATVTWTTSEVSNSKVVYGLTSAYGSNASNASFVTSHSIILTSLTASTTYHFAVVSTDAAGNTSTSTDKLFTTQTGLLGVNISGPEFAPWNGQKFPTNADFSYLAGKGVTTVRLPIAWESLRPTLSAALDSTYLGKIQTALSNANANGIKVIVDLHNFGAYCNQAHWVSSGCGYAGNAGSTGTGVNFLGDGTLTQANLADVWTRLSTALVGTPGLLGYDLMNEPVFGLLQYGTNLLSSPNGFANTVGSQAWFTTNGSVPSTIGVGTNPLNASYGPPWQITSGTGFGSVAQSVTLTNATYTLSAYCKVSSGTNTHFTLLIGGTNSAKTCTTSWQRFSISTTSTGGSYLMQLSDNESGSLGVIQVADAQLEVAASPTTYVPSPWQPFAQAAISAIRGVDASTPVYVGGFNASTAYTWPWVNWDLAALTGGNLVFEAHNYFDGSVTQGGGGGIYSGNYSSYGITSTAGVQEVTPFESWIASTTVSGYVGEYAIPNNSKGDQSSWLTLQNLFLQSLIANNISSSMWFYGAPGLQPGNNLNIATSTTLNAGADDVRLVQMLQQY